MKSTLNEEQALKEYIKKLVKESLEEELFLEKKKKEKKKESKKEDSDKKSETKGQNDNTKKETNRQKKRRMQVEKFLKQDGVNPAQYFYKLFGDDNDSPGDTNKRKNYRSLGYKKRDHELNSDGYPYEFTSQEVNRLIALISSHEIS